MAASRDDMARISGPTNMAKPASGGGENSSRAATPSQGKKKRNRAGRNRNKSIRQSYIGQDERSEGGDTANEGRPGLLNLPRSQGQSGSLFRLHSKQSSTSLESEALLDHRDHGRPKARRRSSQAQDGFARPSLPFPRHRLSTASGQTSGASWSTPNNTSGTIIDEAEDEDMENLDDNTPLLSTSRNPSRPRLSRMNSGPNYGSSQRLRRQSGNSKDSTRMHLEPINPFPGFIDDDYDVNNPPSVPASPRIGSLDDPIIDALDSAHPDTLHEAIIDMDGGTRRSSRSSDISPEVIRRRSIVEMAERDVCFPFDARMPEIAEEEERQSTRGSTRLSRKRTRTRQWPDLEILDEWSREEKEERTQQEHIRAKKIPEPVMVGGRLRPGKTAWHKQEDDAPFRFTYFNETLDGTIHARTISDLVQDGSTFKDLFRPDPIEFSDDSDDDEEPTMERPGIFERQPSTFTLNARFQGAQQTKKPAVQVEESEHPAPSGSKPETRSSTPNGQRWQSTASNLNKKSKPMGPAPTFWLDVLQPTEMEMKVLAKAFGIHQLTAEDILMEEPREKVEIFQFYYFINYRSFEQDKDKSDYMEPVNMYAVVFRDGVITFHHSMTPHPANVRRRIRQLNDYMSPTADWISYAIIDDVTDVYAPLVSDIEQEVDRIDDEILYLHDTTAYEDAGGNNQRSRSRTNPANDEKARTNSWSVTGNSKSEIEKTPLESGGEMLRRVGECRKKVMGLYRLLGQKADVIKGFAKRCNEHWEVAPRSEIGLYLGDIQDHIVTMNGNLSHYENLLSRAHSNYLAQINIRMNERAEKTADVLGKLTVLGTIVLPMNIITGMWGMNVWVPGQEYEGNLTWFWCITAGLFAFGVTCFFVAKKVYGIV